MHGYLVIYRHSLLMLMNGYFIWLFGNCDYFSGWLLWLIGYRQSLLV